MGKNLKLEIACYNVESAIIAERAGADRIELCASPLDGGITPSKGIIQTCLNSVSIPVNVMIRPRGGDFKYNAYEIDSMKSDIALCKELGAAGVVFGVLTATGDLDLKICKELVEMAKPMKVTLHRAFDMAKNLNDTLEKAILCGFDTILTSGGMQTAPEGADKIKELVKLAKNRIVIMPGSGVRPDNIQKLHKSVKAHEYHSSAGATFASSMKYKNPNITMASNPETSEYILHGVNFNSACDLKEALTQL